MHIGRKVNSLNHVVEIDKEKCLNCHACIAACPVKYCNDGSGEHVDINHDMCIGCGNCLKHCKHDARYYIDDFKAFKEDLANGKPMVVIVAPSVAANFKDNFLNINGWLKSLGVEAVFDVSFGAELTVKSYVNYIKNNNPKTVIAQPCPSIVTYIELYKPELLQFLAPVDSPMAHTMKMVKNFYPEYKDHSIAILSPCIAKKREFAELGIGEYNIAFSSINEYLAMNNIDLNSFPKDDYDNPPAERAVLFSTPGGLLETAERWLPGIRNKTRKIEGVNTIYDYLEELTDALEDGSAPLLIDCLNCEQGCNGGPLTLKNKGALDSVEKAVSDRWNSERKDFDVEENQRIQQEIEDTLNKFWTPELFKRQYKNHTANNSIFYPSDAEMKEIFEEMHKYSDDDIYNCNACGYGSCENMAIAIKHNLNRKENCHFYLAEEAARNTKEISDNEKQLRTILYTANQGFVLVDETYNVILVNPKLCEMFGTEQEKLLGTVIFKNLFESCKSKGKDQIETKIKNVKGESRAYLFAPTDYHNDEGEVVGHFALLTDISDYKTNLVKRAMTTAS